MPRDDFYQSITQKIVDQLSQGVRPWQCPWNATSAFGPPSRPLRSNGRRYSGVNVLVLWLEAQLRSYSIPVWITFRQAKELGGSVKKGEKSTTVVYANSFEKTETNADIGEEEKRNIPFLRAYPVFNVDQVSGLPEHFYARQQPNRNLEERLDAVEEFFKAVPIEKRHGGNRAYYSPNEDYIQLPPYDSFATRSSFYATLSHESIHATGSPKRLNREFGKRFGDKQYAFEELIAELGAAFLCADLSITPEVMPEHGQYLAAWLSILKEDSKALFTAASQASRAVQYLHSLQPGYDSEQAEPNEIASTVDV
jgi:antirestriction protein ArdC